MAITRITDVVEPELFAQYSIERTVRKNMLVKAGILAPESRITERMNDGGGIINLPFWGNLDAIDDEVLSDSSALTPAKIAAQQDAAAQHYRGKPFAANDLAGVFAGDDPMRAIADQVGDWWDKVIHKIVVATLHGIFATTLSATHVNDIAIEDGDNATDAALVSDDAILDTLGLHGDKQGEIAAIMAHSTVVRRMMKLDLVEDTRPSEGARMLRDYRGRVVIEDDGVKTVAGTTSGTKYWTYFFRQGALGWGEKQPPVAVETDRDSLAGDDYLIHRRHFVAHPRGVRFTGTPVGAGPTNAELETGGNWSKVYDDKNVGVLALVSNG